MALWSRLLLRSVKSRGSATSVPTRSVRVAVDLYIDDMRASMSVKKVAGAGSPIARRCAFVGHLRNAINTAAVIELWASIISNYAGVSADTVGNQSHRQMHRNPSSPSAVGRCSWRRFAAVAHGRLWHEPAVPTRITNVG
jgi:hypothetical protein